MKNPEDIFEAVRQLPAGERAAYLEEVCEDEQQRALVESLLADGHEVTGLDNFFTGRKANLRKVMGHERFELIRHDIVQPILFEADEIYHLACPASPVHYQHNPIKTVKTNVLGALHALGIGARCLGLFLGTAQLRRGDHLHRRGDALGRFHRCDSDPKIFEAGHVT